MDINSVTTELVLASEVNNHSEVKLRRVEQLMKLYLRGTGCHLPQGITTVLPATRHK